MIALLFRLLRELTPHKKRLLVVAVTGASYAVAYSQMMLMLKNIYDSFEAGQQGPIVTVSGVTLGIAGVVAISRYLHIFTMNYLAELVVNQLRLKLQAKFLRLNLTFHNSHSSGALLSRVLNDVKVVQDGLRLVADLFREPLLLLLLLSNLFWLNWKLTLIILIVLPFLLWFLRQISRSIRKYVEWGQENLERVTSIIKESLDGIRTIQSFNLEKVMEKKLFTESKNYLDIRKKVHARIEVMSPVVEFLATAIILGIFIYFSIEIASGQFTAGGVIAYIGSLMATNQPIKKLQESYVRIQETLVSLKRIYTILDDPTEVPQAGKNLQFPENWERIRFENVSFGFGNSIVIKNINLEIKKGESVALVGESGSGKSTLVNLLERFYDPTTGKIKIDEVDIRDISLTELRSHIALVSQDVFLFRDSIENNIRSGDLSNESRDLKDVTIPSYSEDFIKQLPEGPQTLVGERGNLLSGGEKQRISIARALYKNAPILIMDEATSALDSASEREVQAGLEMLMRGRTSIVIAHRLSTIRNCDRIYVLKSGTIVESGSHDELLKMRGEYWKFWNLQNSSDSK
ncbi:MAG: ABC transporter ATP-binding protein/permease [Bdellovibrionaceae bacterium]|nr:ABC transporter ATP-binding protein/permease [Pseudobdellovibrionaceae bacterium]